MGLIEHIGQAHVFLIIESEFFGKVIRDIIRHVEIQRVPQQFHLSPVFLGRSTAARVAFEEKCIHRMPELVEAHVVELVDILLDPLREAWGGPLTVSSGYRCPELNRAVGGSETSAHLAGWAADLVPGDGRSVQELVNFAVEWLKATGLPFDQLIDERSGGSRWLHIGARNLKGMQRRQMMAYDDGKYTEI